MSELPDDVTTHTAMTAAIDHAETEEIDQELIAVLTESAEDIAAGRVLTLEEADTAFPDQLAVARARIRQEKAIQRN